MILYELYKEWRDRKMKHKLRDDKNPVEQTGSIGTGSVSVADGENQNYNEIVAKAYLGVLFDTNDPETKKQALAQIAYLSDTDINGRTDRSDPAYCNEATRKAMLRENRYHLHSNDRVIWDAKEPTDVFRNDEEFEMCLRYWQYVLGLDNWVIEAYLAEKVIDPDGDEVQGLTTYVREERAAIIKVLKEDYSCDRATRFCAECVLVHELLHLHLCWFTPSDGAAGAYYDVEEHARLNNLARAYIRSKYNVGFDYFRNPDWHVSEEDIKGVESDDSATDFLNELSEIARGEKDD